jgi:hypothetical protein
MIPKPLPVRRWSERQCIAMLEQARQRGELPFVRLLWPEHPQHMTFAVGGLYPLPEGRTALQALRAACRRLKSEAS